MTIKYYTTAWYNRQKVIRWVYIINFVLLQWLFVRLTRYDKVYCLVGFTLPLTGWWNDYKHLGNLKFIWLKRWYFHRWWVYLLLSCVLWSIIIYFVTLFL